MPDRDPSDPAKSLTERGLPVPVRHPAYVIDRSRRGTMAIEGFHARVTPVTLRVHDQARFPRIGTVCLSETGLGETVYAGPGGLWSRLCDADRTPIAPRAFERYLADDRWLDRDLRRSLDLVFSGTPVAADGRGGHPDDATGRAFRGGTAGEGRVALEDGTDVAAARLARFLRDEVAVVDDVVMARRRPFLTCRAGYDLRWFFGPRRDVRGLGVLPARPDTHAAVADLARRMTGCAPYGPSHAWVSLSAWWPEEGVDDALHALNMHAPRLRVRLDERLRKVRAAGDAGGTLDAVSHARRELREVEWRALVGRAGSADHPDDMGAFRRALALEARLAGKAAMRTGVALLDAYMREIAGPRLDRLPAEDVAALEGAAPPRP
jgi:hypothetical protein